jgi:AcrR family transcriptional regulator
MSEPAAPIRDALKTRKEPADPCAPGGDPGSTKNRILESARFLFSEYGFRGTELRDVCERAGADIAVACYYFHSKEELYEAVAKEARQQLAVQGEGFAGCPSDAPPQERLRSVVDSLFGRLGGQRVWIAKLLARELLDPVGGTTIPVGAGMGGDLALLQAAVHHLLGPWASVETVRLCALSVIAQCVFYCLAGEKLHRVFPQLLRPLPEQEHLANHVARFSLEALEHGQPRAEQMIRP